MIGLRALTALLVASASPALAQITFESRDADKNDRSSRPVYVKSVDKQTGEVVDVVNNKINAFMDHVWDGFYTGQIRLQKFISNVDTSYDYEIEYTGTPPNQQWFRMDGKFGIDDVEDEEPDDNLII